MNRLQKAIDHIAATCLAEGVTEAVICPGSRNAPLTIAFVRSGKFNCLSVADERSAGFIALGKALALKKPVALICTSGSAVVNFYPAIVEAYYQQVPLLVITADRPSEMIDEWDGQTIRQAEVFGSHVLGFWQTPESYVNNELFGRITADAIRKATFTIPGPVHINVPLREPLYPNLQHEFTATWEKSPESSGHLSTDHFDYGLADGKKVLVIRGMRRESTGRIPEGIAVYEDILCRSTEINETVSELLFMGRSPEYLDTLKPDILITDGTAILSKALKQFLRIHQVERHFHFSAYGEIADPFGTGPELVRASLDDVLPNLAGMVDPSYTKYLIEESTVCRSKHEDFFGNTAWNEFKAVYTSLHSLPDSAVVHAANSMAIRYVSYCEPRKKGHPVFANRGTSGIDGCVSTALGFASIHKGNNFLIVGDVAFFYDSNAFWNALKAIPLKIILINNGGGGIFRLIDGPGLQPESREYFESSHERNAADLCRNLGVNYLRASDEPELEKALLELNKSERASVLEVFTDMDTNQRIFNQYKSIFHGV